MTPLLKKLNYKDQKSVWIINAPESFQEVTHHLMASEVSIKDHISDNDKIDFALMFVSSEQEIATLSSLLSGTMQGDAVIWFCFPKSSSKKYKCEINRDNGWISVRSLEMEPVRIVAIDDDWSALRFRKLKFIKELTRKFSTPVQKNTPN
ncbi:MAG: hypothetical protein KA010_04115 [Saprospiraceae bacterium]|nr:hypothetical protein [Saprospiraceae bacterium]